MTRRRSEDAIQRAVFEHLRARPARGVFCFHVPNGGYRSRTEAAILKGIGVTPGVPDVIAIRGGESLRARTEGTRASVAHSSALTE
jgi:hypothetical protein